MNHQPKSTAISRRGLLAGSLGCAAAPARASEDQRVEDLLRRLTLEEKAFLCHGNVTKDTGARFLAGGVPRLGIGQLKMLDGRQGVRPMDDKTRTTSLPCTLSLSCTWDPEAASDFGRLLAEEMLATGQHVLLAPCMNLMRSPLGGRNFENFGEDPYLAGRFAAAYIQGVQKAGVAACSAILVANDWETRRHYASSNLDERTLREMHLLPFEMSITDGRVWTMMTANNLVNGVHVAANRHVVQEIVKDKLGFDGVMLTDWRAAYDTVPTALAGTDMTTGFCAYVFGEGRLAAAVKSGEVPARLLDEKARRILRLYARTGLLNPSARPKGALETPAHRATARRLAAGGMVLMKNSGGLLPLDTANIRSILVTGPGADTVPFGGSGAVRPPFQITPWQGLQTALGDKVELVHLPWKTASQAPEREAMVRAARSAGIVLFFATDARHGEGNDRKDLDLPGGQGEVIGALAEANSKLAVVLLTGGPVLLEPWAERVPAILGAWYAGQSTGDAVADVLTGKVVPGGKLSFTFGRRLEDYACHALGLWPPRLVLNHPGPPPATPEGRRSIYAYAADYKEGVFMGYRWFDEKKIEPRFPFGHGLSYTTFAYSAMQVRQSGGLIRVVCTVKNTGRRAGAEVVQVYVEPPASSVARPPRELKGFVKVAPVKPGESRKVEIALRPSALAYFDAAGNQWRAGAGEYRILAGSSSRDIRLQASLKLAAARVYERF